jgi:hypothetical protein
MPSRVWQCQFKSNLILNSQAQAHHTFSIEGLEMKSPDHYSQLSRRRPASEQGAHKDT